MLTDAMDVFSCLPSNHLLSDREEDEAYAFVEEGRQYAAYFPDGGTVGLDLSGAPGSLSMRWLDILNGEWRDVQPLEGGKIASLSPPGPGPWAVLIRRAE